MMPSFSPDGRRIVFNDYDSGQGHSLAVMDFDDASNAFSNRKEIADAVAESAVVGGAPDPARWQTAVADLRAIVDNARAHRGYQY
jgi:hypothetical protein